MGCEDNKIVLGLLPRAKYVRNSALRTHTNKDLIKYAAMPPNQPQWCILTDYFNNYNFSKLK